MLSRQRVRDLCSKGAEAAVVVVVAAAAVLINAGF